MTIDARKLQTALGVPADGVIGRVTFATLFMRFGCGLERAQELALSANVHFAPAGIMDSPLRLAHFIAQLAHESGGFRYMEEIASGAAYEGRSDLGNVQPGDGKRYKGRGPIQLTGRANYREYGRALGIDFENHPEVVALPSVGLMVACRYWATHKLNALADADDIEATTRRINGGLNGLADRKGYLAKAKGLLDV
jgi:putative chitinase